MRDNIGNKIKEGDYVRWNIPEALRCQLVFKVIQVSDGGIATPDGNTPPILQLSVVLPIATQKSEAVLEDFVCVRDPKSDGLIDQLTGGKPS